MNKLTSNPGYPLLAREFIYDRLYHRESGYFTKKENMQLGELRKVIKFNELLGYEDYQRELHTNYPEYAWLTPSEIFRPYYGITIGNYIHKQFNYMKSLNPTVKTLKIMEAGAGFGAACEGILQFQKLFNPLQKFEYHVVEISGPACEHCEKRLHEAGFKDQLKSGQIRIVQGDVMSYMPQVNPNDAWFHVFLEVFDNLPHDRVYGILEGNSFQEVWVDLDEKNQLVEKLKPLNDPLIKECFDLYKTFALQQRQKELKNQESFWNRQANNLVNFYFGKPKLDNYFLPTYALKVLKQLNRNFGPNTSLIMADFETLHNPYTKEGSGAPIVSKKLKKPHEKEDYKDYLIERGQADIFFPTDFEFMKFLYKKIYNRKAQQMKAHEFMDQFSRQQWTTTSSGYNPLKEDFKNTSFLLSDHSL